MLKRYVTISFVTFFLASMASFLISNSGGAPTGRSGSPIDVGTCAVASCHGSFALNSGPGNMSITSDIPTDGFIAGNTYSITVNVAQGGNSRFGFSSSTYGENTMDQTGSIVITDPGRTQKRTSGTREWITHSFNGINATDQASWSYDWTATADNDSVTFYAAGMGSNNNRNTAGDHVYSTSLGATRQFGVSIDPSTIIQNLRAFPSPASSTLVVEGNIEENGTMIITMQDLSGREVYRFEDDVTPGNFSNIIDVTAFTSGIYTLRTNIGRAAVTRKVIIE